MTSTRHVQPNPEALIVGAGPTGLTLANELACYGVAFRIVDKAPYVSQHTKALGVQAERSSGRPPRSPTCSTCRPPSAPDRRIRHGGPTEVQRRAGHPPHPDAHLFEPSLRSGAHQRLAITRARTVDQAFDLADANCRSRTGH
jgi:hypothetical protein